MPSLYKINGMICVSLHLYQCDHGSKNNFVPTNPPFKTKLTRLVCVSQNLLTGLLFLRIDFDEADFINVTDCKHIQL